MAVTKIRGNTQIIDGSILNAQINASAAIAESKLSLDYGTSTLNTAIGNHTSDTNNPHSVNKADVLTGDLIVNADVDAGAAIAYSKLALTGEILNADLAGSIAYSKLALTGEILNADLAGSIALSKLAEAVIQADGGQAFTSAQPMGNNKLTGLATGTEANDAVNLGQVQALQAGLSWKDKVRWASGASIADLSEITVADPDGEGQGITLVEGDRILVKDTASVDGIEGLHGKRNGIYVVGVVDTGKAPVTRATDSDTADEVESASCFVDEGANADNAFVQTADNVTLETTVLTFIQFTGAALITAGAGLTKSTDTINVIAADQSLTISADDMQVKLDATAGTIDVGGAGLQIADGTAGQILIGKGAAVDTAFTTITGDITLSSGGVVAIASGVIVNADVKSDAAIVYSKLSIADADLTIAKTNGLQTALDGKVDENGAISGATKTKITYDTKGLVTSGADATTADIDDSSDRRYVTDAQLVVIGNTSGSNTGDQDLSGLLSETLTDNYIFVGDVSNDAVGVAVSGDITIDSDGVVAIASGVIVDADVKSDAAIAFSKLATLSDGNILVGSAGNVATSVNPSGDIDVSNAGVFSIASGVIVNTDVKSDAAIAFSKLASLTSTNFLVGNGSAVATAVAMSGDATMDNTGAVTLASTVLKEADVVTRDVPTGDYDGADTTYVLANTPVAGTESVYWNGILQNVGGGNDYTISGATITFAVAPLANSVILVNYLK